MAEKDITSKILMSYADVFADCINTLVYNGMRRLSVEETQPAPTESFYKGYKGKKRKYNQFCDVSRYLTEKGVIVAQYIIENETNLQRKQVLRKASYQGGAYRQQLEDKGSVYAVIAIVLNWTGKSTSIPLSLHRLLANNGASPKELSLVDDIRLAVYHMKNLPKETRQKFVSDMGFVVDYLNEGDFESRRNQKIVHLEALCEMMEAITGDTRFTEQIGKLLIKEKKGEEVIMCEYIDRLEARGEERGKKIGEERGKIIGEKKLSSLLEKLYSLGRDEDVKLAVQNEAIRTRLYEEFCIAD